MSLTREYAQLAVTAYLDSLLGELPEEAREAATEVLAQRYSLPTGTVRCDATLALSAACQALRDSLASGTGQQHEE